jgi:hypothetical protein
VPEGGDEDHAGEDGGGEKAEEAECEENVRHACISIPSQARGRRNGDELWAGSRGRGDAGDGEGDGVA